MSQYSDPSRLPPPTGQVQHSGHAWDVIGNTQVPHSQAGAHQEVRQWIAEDPMGRKRLAHLEQGATAQQTTFIPYQAYGARNRLDPASAHLVPDRLDTFKEYDTGQPHQVVGSNGLIRPLTATQTTQDGSGMKTQQSVATYPINQGSFTSRGGYQSAASVANHELTGHATQEYDTTVRNNQESRGEFGNRSEENAIRRHENPAAAMHGEGPRDDHHGSRYETDGVTSTTPIHPVAADRLAAAQPRLTGYTAMLDRKGVDPANPSTTTNGDVITERRNEIRNDASNDINRLPPV